MKLRRALPFAAGLVALGIIVFLAFWLLRFGLGALSSLFGDWKQIVVAGIAAAVMGVVGLRLTTGQGNLATAGQYEKIAVWAALLLSVVSAITTSLGLLIVLSPNPRTGALLMVGMAVLLGVGIQLSMLMYALRIGDGVQRLSPVTPSGDGEEDEETEADDKPRSRFSLWTVLGIFLLFVIGGAMVFGSTLVDLLSAAFDSIVSETRADFVAPKVLGAVLVFVALLLTVRLGFLSRPGTVAGLVISVAIYGVLLLFSSGFGYMAYFLAAQSEDVQAIDRDNRIETETAALVRRIRDAASEDVREALLEARSGRDYADLSERIDTLSSLFVKNRGRLDDQVSAYEARRQQVLAQRDAAVTRADTAEKSVREAEQAVERANRALTRARNSRERQLLTLTEDLKTQEKRRIDAAAGRDETGVAICGPICRSAQRQVDRIKQDIAALDDAVAVAKNGVATAEAKHSAAQRNLQKAKTSKDGSSLEDPVPPAIVDRTSFTTPRNEYNVNPTKEGLKRISATCATARDMLITLGLRPADIPSCEVSNVEVWMTRHEEGKQALVQMEQPCKRTDEEMTQEATALAKGTPPNVSEIPPHLRGRLAWVTRCLTAANTGSPRLKAVARDVNQLESEYTTPGYDVRRVLRALNDGNLYAIYSLLMALVVDTAILFAGFAANAYRGRELGEDHRLVSADRIAERIRKTLTAARPDAPSLAATQMTMMWEPRTVDEIGRSPFTHKLRFENGAPEKTVAMRRVLDAAGPAFARYVERGGERFWLLHHNFVALIIEFAAAGETPGAASPLVAQHVDSLFGSATSGVSAITPLIPGSPVIDHEPGGDSPSRAAPQRRKIDLGPEAG